jgi:ABC-type dipeptide/oligopeptide/nickel transport system permease subunit
MDSWRIFTHLFTYLIDRILMTAALSVAGFLVVGATLQYLTNKTRRGVKKKINNKIEERKLK